MGDLKATEHRKEEKEGHVSEFLLSPGCEVSGTGQSLCVPRPEIRAYEYLGVEPPAHWSEAISSYGVSLSPVNMLQEARKADSNCASSQEGLGRWSLPWGHGENEQCSRRPGQNGPPSLRLGILQPPSLPPGDESSSLALSLSTTSLYPPNKSESNFLALYS